MRVDDERVDTVVLALPRQRFKVRLIYIATSQRDVRGIRIRVFVGDVGERPEAKTFPRLNPGQPIRRLTPFPPTL